MQREQISETLTHVSHELDVLFQETGWENCEHNRSTINQVIIPLIKGIQKPKVMVYGIYNSGKSTLINALCRKEVAAVADRPMTNQIAEIDRGDYILVDSPGVDAPIQHERVTESHLDKCHIILFVMSSKGSFESVTNYKKMVQLIERNIPFLIVLNEHGGAGISSTDSDSERARKTALYDRELRNAEYKIIENLKRYGTERGIQNIDQKYEIIRLNAKRAWTGVIKDKNNLYDKSNVEKLNTRIYQILHDANTLKLFQQPIQQLLVMINEVESDMTAQLSGQDREFYTKKILLLQHQTDNLLGTMRVLIRSTVYGHQDAAVSAALSDNSEGYQRIYDTIKQEVDEIYTAKANELVRSINQIFRSLSDVDPLLHRQAGKTDDATWTMPTFSAEDSLPTAPDSYENEENSEITLTDRSDWSLPVSGLSGAVISPMPPVPDHITDHVILIKIAGKIISDAGKIISEFFARKKEEEQQRRKMEEQVEQFNQAAQDRLNEEVRKRQSARQQVQVQMDDVYRTLSLQLGNQLTQILNSSIDQLQQANTLSHERSKRIRQWIQRLRELKQSINVVASETT